MATSSSERTPEQIAYLQRRLALYGKVTAAVQSIALALEVVVGLTLDRWQNWGETWHWLQLCAWSLCGVVWLLCRRGQRSRWFLRALEAVALLGATLCIAVMGRYLLPHVMRSTTGHIDLRTQSPDMLDALISSTQRGLTISLMLGLVSVYVIRAALVPSSVRRTAVLTGAAALPLLLVNALGWPDLVVDRPLLELMQPTGKVVMAVTVIIWWSVVTATCCAITAVIHSLRREVRQAQQLGQYTLEEKLGAGGMGDVYRARHGLLRRPTAIKLLRADSSLPDAGLARFEREVRQTARLTHPNTITIYDYGRTPEGVFYYAMELLEGASLDDIVAADGPQPPARVGRIMHMVSSALVEAHDMGLIHRDIKPGNIFLCWQGGRPDVAKVLDFGLVKTVEGPKDATLTVEGTITGTPLYLAPEALIRPKDMDGRSDIYALGAVAYFLLCGEPVFDGANVVEICGHHLHTVPKPPSARLGRPLPADLEALVLRCLAKDPADRPQSAAELCRLIEDCAELGRWTTEDAEGWWQGHANLIRQGDVVSAHAATVAVDLRRAEESAETQPEIDPSSAETQLALDPKPAQTQSEP